MGTVLKNSELQKDFVKTAAPEVFENHEIKDIAKAFIKYYNKNAIFRVDSFKKKYPQFSHKIDFLTLPYENVSDQDELEQEYREYKKRLYQIQIEKIKQHYAEKIRQAEMSKDQNEVKKLIREFQSKVIGK